MSDGQNHPVVVTVRDRVLHRIDERLFGQFMERATFGEPGPESALQPGTRRLQPKALAALKELSPPIIRFPGGTDADYIDWTDMVSNVPGRGAERPVTTGCKGGTLTNNFGLDEYFATRDELGCQTILVVNFLDALRKRKSLAEAARLAAGLVAYCNAPVGASLPEGMPDWPAVRAANGHPEPFGAETFQIGNEAWVYHKKVVEALGTDDPAQLAPWYIECAHAYIDAIRAVDPEVQIIVDGNMGPDLAPLVLADADLRTKIDYLALHAYFMTGLDQIQSLTPERKPELVPHGEVSPEGWWQTWVGAFGWNDERGRNIAIAGEDWERAEELGLPVACTEWNWNCWAYNRIDPTPTYGHEMAAGLGVCCFLHGLMRRAARVPIATQSMLIGSGWGLAAIRVDPKAEKPPHFGPQGMASLFYRRHHGSEFLDADVQGAETYDQPYTYSSTGWTRRVVAWVDVVATRDEKTVYVHAVNRRRLAPATLEVGLSGVAAAPGSARQWTYTGTLDPPPGYHRPMCGIEEHPIELVGPTVRLEIPAHSALILEVPRESA
jgi:alpha-L-arabinofuranosidase